jgi:AraC-like DNA-binding protein
LIPGACKVLQELQVSASICLEGPWGIYWAVFQQSPNVISIEVEHGAWEARHLYNERCIERARREKRSVLGEHGGFFDFFVPICVEDRVQAVIVSGPFARSRPTSFEVLERWQRVTGRHGHPGDPEFAMYFSLTLSTLVLDGRDVAAFRTLLERMASLIADRSLTDNAHDAEKALGADLRRVRFVERAWEAAGKLIDERISRSWTRAELKEQRQDLGLKDVPDHVVVGLFVNRKRDSEPIDELLRGDAFQRACVELAHKRGNAVSGQIGDHGVTFLGGAGPRARRRLLDLAKEAAQIARQRFGLELYLGVTNVWASLPVQYRSAMGAAESALASDTPLVQTDAEPRITGSLGGPASELARQIEQNPQTLPARFDRFLELVAARAGHRVDLARAHLEAAFERVAEAVLGSGALDGRSLQSLRENLERSADRARTMNELFALYRRVNQDLADGIAQPAAAHQERSMRRAEEYVREHYTESITLSRVARIGGFSPTYFSKLFHKREKRTFVEYLTSLRIARAKELLAGTSLNLQRIAELSGFSRAQYLSQVFRKATSLSPAAYRRRYARMISRAYGLTRQRRRRVSDAGQKFVSGIAKK